MSLIYISGCPVYEASRLVLDTECKQLYDACILNHHTFLNVKLNISYVRWCNTAGWSSSWIIDLNALSIAFEQVHIVSRLYPVPLH